MTDYSELVKALRCENHPCKECEYILWFEDEDANAYTCDEDRLHHDAADAIEALQAEMPKRGEWSEENRRPRSSQFVCSVCHRTAYDPQPTRDKAWRKRCRYAYCPRCGAKMEVQE